MFDVYVGLVTRVHSYRPGDIWHRAVGAIRVQVGDERLLCPRVSGSPALSLDGASGRHFSSSVVALFYDLLLRRDDDGVYVCVCEWWVDH